jgi:hypothetical protein
MPLLEHPPAFNYRSHLVAAYYTYFAARSHLVLEWFRLIQRRLGSLLAFNVCQREMRV